MQPSQVQRTSFNDLQLEDPVKPLFPFLEVLRGDKGSCKL